MERIVELNGKNLALGLGWSSLAGDNPSEAAKKLANSRKSTSGLVWSVSVVDQETGNTSIIHSVGLSSGKYKGAIYSAAAALARGHNGVIGIERLADDMYWLVVTEDGRVLPGYDIVSSGAEVKRKLQDLMIVHQLDYMTFYMAADVAKDFGIEEAVFEGPLALVGTLGVDDSIRLRKMKAIPKTVFMGAGIVILGAGLFGFIKHQEIQKQKELEALMALEAASLENIEKDVTVDKVIEKGPTDADLLRLARQEEINWLRDDFNKVNRIPAMKAVLFTLQSIPKEMNGWRLKGVSFSSSAPDMITAVWERTHGSPNTLKKFLAGRAMFGFSPDFKTATSTFVVDMGSLGIEDILSVVKDKNTKHQDLASMLIESNFKFVSTLDASESRRENIRGLKDKTLESMPQLETAKRSFDVSGDRSSSFTALIRLLENVDNYLINNITFTVSDGGSFTWKLEGKLYE